MCKSPLFLCILFSSLLLVKCNENLTAEEAFKKGAEFLKEKDTKAAYKYLKKAVDKTPDNPFYHWTAAKAAPNRNMAFIHSQAAWDNGLKSTDVLLMLTDLSFQNTKKEKLTYALSLYNDLPDSIRNDVLRGALFDRFEEYDSSIALWERVYQSSPKPELCNKIAIAYSKKGEQEKARKFLLTCKKRKQLDSNGFLLLAYLLVFDYALDRTHALFKEARTLGLYTDKVQLEHAGFLVLEGKLTEAETLLNPLAEPVPDTKEAAINQRARIMLSYVYRAQRRPEKIKHLSTLVQKDSDEPAYYSALCDLLYDSSNALERLNKARQKLPDFPIIDLIYARENARKNNFTEAAKGYKRLPLIFIKSQRILIEYAIVLTKIGKDDEALSLIMTLHKKKRFTKHSLELFRDITFRKKLIKESMAAQKILEKKYKDDASVQYTSAIIALQNGKTDKALSILLKLAKRYPEEQAFEIARIRTYLIKKEYKQVIKECRESSLEVHILCPMLAETYIKLGEPDKAEKVFRKSITQKKSLKLMLAFAQFLTNQEYYEKAVTVYKEIIETYEPKLKEDNRGNALMLNNYVWTLLQIPSSHKKEALSTIKKAYSLYPENLHILDTYATTLLKNAKYKECIKLLKDFDAAKKEPNLLLHLATAYDKIGDTNKAVRTYKDILLSSDSTTALSFSSTKETVQKRIDELMRDK